MRTPRTFYTADTHFSHQLVAGLRGFDSWAEHDERVIEVWNAEVAPDDVVWHLGDISMGSPSRWAGPVSRLNGVLHLIPGNHDYCHPMHRRSHRQVHAYLDQFLSVQAFARRRLDQMEVLLSHFPYAGDTEGRADRFGQYRLPDLGVPILHGHTHSVGATSLSPNGTLQIHVGWDAWSRPVAQEEVVAILRGFQEELPGLPPI